MKRSTLPLTHWFLAIRVQSSRCRCVSHKPRCIRAGTGLAANARKENHTPGILKEWTVLPHGALTRMDTNLLTVVGDLPMPAGTFPRRMTVVRLWDSRLVIYSAIALDEPEMQAIEAWDTPSFPVVPSDIYRNDAKIWKERYPALFVIGPAGARTKVEDVVPVDATSIDFEDLVVRCPVFREPFSRAHPSSLSPVIASRAPLQQRRALAMPRAPVPRRRR